VSRGGDEQQARVLDLLSAAAGQNPAAALNLFSGKYLRGPSMFACPLAFGVCPNLAAPEALRIK